jgi:hypothetical protein
LNSEDTRAGMRWLFVMGSFAILLSLGLFLVDRHLQTSPSEAKLGATLRELRGAQASLGRGEVDPRIVGQQGQLRTSHD